MGVVEAGSLAQAAHAPLRVVGDDDDAGRAREERLIRLRLEEVGRREARVRAHAVHAHEEGVDVEGADGRERDRADERVRRRADTAGEHDGQIRPVVAVEHRRHLERVRQDRQVGDVLQVVREPPRRRAGRQRDRLAGLDERGRRLRDRLLLAQLPVRLRLEARLVGALARGGGGAAVDLLDQAGRGERVEVTADRHLRHVQELGELADADRAAAADLLDDEHLALAGEHERCPCR